MDRHLIKGHPIDGSLFEYDGPWLLFLHCEKDIHNRPVIIFGAGRFTQYRNWFGIILFTAHLGPPWFTKFKGLLHDD